MNWILVVVSAYTYGIGNISMVQSFETHEECRTNLIERLDGNHAKMYFDTHLTTATETLTAGSKLKWACGKLWEEVND